MIFAELQGKLGAGYERAVERSEDLLTSTAFGLLRYLPFERGIGALLKRAQVVHVSEGDLVCAPEQDWLRLGSSYRLEFWPRLAQGGEPDLRVTFESAPTAGAEMVLIEVKLHSGKSSVSSDDEDVEATDEEDDDRPVSFEADQLAGYIQRQKAEMLAGDRVSIVYLTAHRVPPREELQASMRPGMRLAWLSWTDVWQVAQAASQDHVPAADLANVLQHKGLSEFSGFAKAAGDAWIAALGEGSFWRGPTVPHQPEGPLFQDVESAGVLSFLETKASFFNAPVEDER